MSTSLVFDRVQRPFASLLFGFVLMLVPITALQAQGVGSSRGLPSSSSGSNIIQGRVLFPTEPKGGKRIKVRLTSTDALNQTTSTDDDGLFMFNSLPAGHFTITVDGGEEYDTATEQVAIDREASLNSRNINVSIILKSKGAAAAFNKIPKAARESYAKGLEAVNKGDSAKAVEHFKKAVEVDPKFALAWSQLGTQQLKLGQLDDAIASFRTALKLDSDDVDARQGLGTALLNKNEFAEAEKELREVVSKNAKSATAHMYLGVTLSRLKKEDEAEAELVLAIGLPGGDKLAMAHKFLGGIYWKKGQKQQAADELEKYVTLAPKAPDVERIRETIKQLRAGQ